MEQYKQFFTRMEGYQPTFVVSEQAKRRKGKENSFSVFDVVKECSANGGRDIHFTASDSARKKFLTNSMKHWGIAAQQLVLQVSSILASVVAVTVKRHFIHFKNLHVDALYVLKLIHTYKTVIDFFLNLLLFASEKLVKV